MTDELMLQREVESALAHFRHAKTDATIRRLTSALDAWLRFRFLPSARGERVDVRC